MYLNWFKTLTGVEERDVKTTFQLLDTDTDKGKIRFPNGRICQYGKLTRDILAKVRRLTENNYLYDERTTVKQYVGDVTKLHIDPANNGAMFQAASQFNLLEMVGPSVTPERGVTGYIGDRTQGPACALSAPAGTIYRNYFADTNGFVGQSATNQIDCMYDMGLALGNKRNALWTMRNGYLWPTETGLQTVFDRLAKMDSNAIDHLRSLLRVGVQWNTEIADVMQPNAPQGQFVQQAYCSALPVAYAGGNRDLWAPFARLVLEASYEHTLRSAVINKGKNGSNKVFLTYVGGGVFGNRMDWIHEAMFRALKEVEWAGLDVVVVSYGRETRETNDLISQWNSLNK